MTRLLTSLGVSNASMRAALATCWARRSTRRKGCVPTVIYALPTGVAESWQMLHAFASMGWRNFGVVELTTLPTLLESNWLPTVEVADCIIGVAIAASWYATTGELTVRDVRRIRLARRSR